MVSRLEEISSGNELENKRIVVTGCGYKPLITTFYDIVTGKPSHDPIFINDEEFKLNIGSAISGVLAKKGAIIHMVSTSEDKLKKLKESLDLIIGSNKLEYSALDLLNKKSVKDFVKNFPKDKEIYWVQSVGLGAGSYKLKDDNPYLPLEDIPIELLEKELKTAIRATHLMLNQFRPVFKKQNETKIAIISSMSAIRGYSYGGTHCTAKGAIDRYANSIMLALYKENIFVTTVRPGGVDTGMYDNPKVQEAVKVISDEYGGLHRNHFVLAPPTSVGEAIAYAFSTPAHIPSLNLVAKGQFPNEGS
ncbi:MAG: SDR family oxidoreductase [Candidatus Diapherotrites archaeon]